VACPSRTAVAAARLVEYFVLTTARSTGELGCRRDQPHQVIDSGRSGGPERFTVNRRAVAQLRHGGQPTGILSTAVAKTRQPVGAFEHSMCECGQQVRYVVVTPTVTPVGVTQNLLRRFVVILHCCVPFG